MQTTSIDNVTYRFVSFGKTKYVKKSISVIGLDTEAYKNGQTAMICTSEGDTYKLLDCPSFFFSRKYRQCNFVCYNLSYDEGALLQFLSVGELDILRRDQKVTHEDYVISCIPKKMLSIRKGSHSIHIWDMYSFFMGSLDYNAKKYLGKQKLDIETKVFTKKYFKENYENIKKYCIQDAILVKELAELLIKKFESFGVYPRKLYSTAYISYMYFQKNTNYVTVKKYWDRDKKVLDFALKSYAGGKFEVTEKGTGYFYEYDIISAYPAEIAKLEDINFSRIVWDNKYRRFASYGFLHVKMKITKNINSPVPIKIQGTCTFPVGYIETYITKTEYEYLISLDIDITIIEACWLHNDKKMYPYEKTIKKFVEYKQKYKDDKDSLDYHTVKIFMNSIYGKMCQLIKKGDKYEATNCWNPIYAAVITANVRTIISRYQQLNPEIIAVHTDSIISKKKLDTGSKGLLGDMKYECEGLGVVMGSGVYQIGDKSRFRTFRLNIPITDLLKCKESSQKITENRAFSWREVAFHSWDHEMINRFEVLERTWNVAADFKRMWLDDYKTFDEVIKRNVYSLPLFNTIFRPR
ncbi:MAG: hypothetical protein PHI02_09295 [Sulfurovaceae bacterium]|nr:hypothetical protein [Sulfurovaceae bacterium]